MKRVVWFIWMAVLLSGCGLFRDVHKTKDVVRSSAEVEIKKDSVGLRVDKSRITTVERIDTVATVQGATIAQNTMINKDSLINGMMAIRSDLVDVKLKLDPKTGILTATADVKDRQVPVKLDRTIDEQRDITDGSSVNSSIEGSISSSETHSQVDKKGVDIPSWVWFLVAGVAVFALWYWNRKK